MFSVEVYNSDTSTWSAIDESVLRLSVQRGMAAGGDLSALPAAVEVVLSNHAGTYSPNSWRYGGTPAVGQRIRVLHGTEPVFTGHITSIAPAAGAFGERTVVLSCSDLLDRLQRMRIKLPQATTLRTDEALRRCTAAAFATGTASGVVSISGKPNNGDTVTIGGTTYTFRDTPVQAYEVARGNATDGSDAAQALAAAINDDAQDASLYAANTPRHPTVTAAVELSNASSAETLLQNEEDMPTPDWAWVGIHLGLGGSARHYLAQRITPAQTGQISQVEAYLEYVAYLSGSGQSIKHTLVVEVYSVNVSGLPGTKLGSGQLARTFTWPATGAWAGWETFVLDAPVTVYAGTRYWIVLRPLEPLTTGFTINNWYTVKWHGTDAATQPWGVASYETPVFGEWHVLDGSKALRMSVTVDNIATRVVLTANAHGAWGNDISLAASGAALSVNGATLAGGADYDNQLMDEGRVTLDLFAPISEDSDALSIMLGIVDSEYGRLYCDRQGRLVFRSRTWVAERANGSAVATLAGDYIDLLAEAAGERLVNLVRVGYTPPRKLTSGVVARSTRSISVPGRGGTFGSLSRWNSAQPVLSEQGTTTITLPFVSPEDGERMSADVVYTPVPGNDYTVTDAADGTGYNYTSGKRLRLSLAVTSSGVEVTFVNTATGTLYVHDLQVRGVGQVFRERQEAIAQDTQSQELYGVYEETLDLPHSLIAADIHATSLTSHILARYRTPRVRVSEVVVDAVTAPAWLTRDIGDKIVLSDEVLGDTEALIMGMQLDYEPHTGQLPVTLVLYDTDGRTYWQLGHSSYGRLGDTTRLAL